MDLIEIQLDAGRATYQPGEVLSGTVSWELAEPASGVEVRLFWYTSGKGSTDVRVVKAVQLASAGTSGSGRFKFVLPDEPYSFSGRLISLIWALEAVAQPGERPRRRDLVVAPGGDEVRLANAGVR